MRAIFRFIAANNFLPIAVTFVGYRFFSIFYTYSVDYFFAFGATFFCWLVYFIDKIKDSKAIGLNAVSRHKLTYNDKMVQYFMGSCLAILCSVNFHVFSFKSYYAILISAPFIFSYFYIPKRYLKYFKEIFSSLVMVVVLSIFPIINKLSLAQPIYHLLFFLMILGNMFLLSLSDYEIDKSNQFVSLSTSIGYNHMMRIGFVLLAVILGISFFIESIFLANWARFYILASILIFIYSKKKCDKNLVHILADSVFLFPLIYL